MNLSDIKKQLYRLNPEARISYVKDNVVCYYADLPDLRVKFFVHTNDMGNTMFEVKMDSKYLIRWIQIQ